MKYCIDCKYHRRIVALTTHDYCHHPLVMAGDPVAPKEVACWRVRGTGNMHWHGLCGQEAKLFEPIPPKPERRPWWKFWYRFLPE